MLQWVKPRAAAVKSLRLRGNAGGEVRQNIVNPAFAMDGLSSWGDFTGCVPFLSDPVRFLAH